MKGISRPAPAAPARSNSMRPPQVRPQVRSQSINPPFSHRPGAVSPSESVASIATTHNGMKRKERDYEQSDAGDETNINVFVRCRGRNEREVRENSGVVLTTDGVKGKTVELSMGPSALSNKTYHFDKVFSPAADQSMIYDDVVTPILDEMLAGYNCTIFAYGQTGTGKTYTMSGDMSDTLGMLSDAAGIIPRALHALFNKLALSDTESSVKCSFIELYNEELRDLISAEENSKIKIFEDNSKRGHASTIVQGMEESHIKSAVEGVKLLRQGSHKRQVAATKCNDLSSRSHTVFTVTAYIKRTADSGEDYISAGKLNLVDLAGSENIQRSGAENKRAAEAGLINRSLLTLGRVINALVDRSSHIPYRESKLTRLLQDSLGGRTKTCIIATVSPAKSNLEETISTLDYAFRAKNIRNKPQVNQMINKKTLLKDFTNEIEKLKGELIATRQRNGVYLSNENYEEITVESESRRILNEEQAAKIETMETNLRNKVQDLYSMTLNFMGLKKDHEGTRATLDETRTLLEQTEFVLANTRQSLAEEALLRRAHEETEGRLNAVGGELISTLERTVGDVGGLHSKLRRRSDLQNINRNTWGSSQAQVSEVTSLVESRVQEFRAQQEILMASISTRMQSFVQDELNKLSSTQTYLKQNAVAFAGSDKVMSKQALDAKKEMDQVLEEIKTVREEVKSRVGEGLQGLSAAAERISAEVISELGAFHTQLHGSYSSLGRDFKNLFEDLLKHINFQRDETNVLRKEITAATELAMQSSAAASTCLDAVLKEERQQLVVDRQNLLSQITNLITDQGNSQDARITAKICQVQKDIISSKDTFEVSRLKYCEGMDVWNEKEAGLAGEVLRSRATLKSKLKEDWVTANKHYASIQTATKSVHEETIRIVGEQMKDVGIQMQALDDFVTRARSQNAEHHDSHVTSLEAFSTTVRNSYDNIGTHFTLAYERAKDLGQEMHEKTSNLDETLSNVDVTLGQPLADLRSNITMATLHEYVPTGETPQKVQYQYPTTLPRTEPHEYLLAHLRRPACTSHSASSPTKTIPVVFNDSPSPRRPADNPLHIPDSESMPTLGLREIDANIKAGTISSGNVTTTLILSSTDINGNGSGNNKTPLLKKSLTGVSGIKPRKSLKKPASSVIPLEGRENAAPPNFSSSIGRRRSPRTH